MSGLRHPDVGRGMSNTFQAGWWFIRWPLNHLFHSEHFTLEEIRRLHTLTRAMIRSWCSRQNLSRVGQIKKFDQTLTNVSCARWRRSGP